ncbi:hypothetical protein DFH06DRAFT_1343480 [Mycena polygramma]|nr:hypothetical protein DFH06DRAFT_1343480 [Mycena polygramma]
MPRDRTPTQIDWRASCLPHHSLTLVKCLVAGAGASSRASIFARRVRSRGLYSTRISARAPSLPPSTHHPPSPHARSLRLVSSQLLVRLPQTPVRIQPARAHLCQRHRGQSACQGVKGMEGDRVTHATGCSQYPLLMPLPHRHRSWRALANRIVWRHAIDGLLLLRCVRPAGLDVHDDGVLFRGINPPARYIPASAQRKSTPRQAVRRAVHAVHPRHSLARAEDHVARIDVCPHRVPSVSIPTREEYALQA